MAAAAAAAGAPKQGIAERVRRMWSKAKTMSRRHPPEGAAAADAAAAGLEHSQASDGSGSRPLRRVEDGAFTPHDFVLPGAALSGAGGGSASASLVPSAAASASLGAPAAQAHGYVAVRR